MFSEITVYNSWRTNWGDKSRNRVKFGVQFLPILPVQCAVIFADYTKAGHIVDVTALSLSDGEWTVGRAISAEQE